MNIVIGKAWLITSTTLLILLLALVSASFTTAKADGEKVVFVGDVGTESSGKATIQAIKNEHPNLALLLGDLGYSSSASAFAEQVKTLRDAGIQVYCDIGNHDSSEEESDKTEQTYWKLCADGDGFFTLKNGPLTIVGLNTQRTLGISTNYLKTVEMNEFVIVTSHKPLCETPKSKHEAIKCDSSFMQQLQRLDVDAKIGAHNHCDAFKNGNFIAGAGGRSHYACSTTGGWWVNDDDFSYLLLTIVNKDRLDFVFKNQKGAEISTHFFRTG